MMLKYQLKEKCRGKMLTKMSTLYLSNKNVHIPFHAIDMSITLSQYETKKNLVDHFSMHKIIN